MKKTYLAFDLGASSGRGILGTIEDGKISLNEIHRFPNGPKEINGELYWDFDSLISEIKTGLKKAVAACDEIAGIAVDTWGVDYVLLKENGEFARLPYQYRDSRTDGVPEELFENIISQEDLYSKVGIQSMFFNTIYQLMAHSRQHPEDFENAKLLFMPDAISYMLSGNPTCEYTIASTSGLLNARTRTWDYEVIEKIGLPKDIFPEIVPPCTPAGTLKDELKKEFGCGDIPIYRTGSHDTASAVASVPANPAKKWAYISCGTWALFGIENDAPILTPEAMKAGCTNEGGLNGKIRFLTNINGTWLIQETRRVWKEAGKDLTFRDIEEMAAGAPASEHRIDPNDQLFVPPGDMPARVREYCEKHGESVPESDRDVLRCIYDSLAMCFSDKLKEFEKLGNMKFDVLHIVGGGTNDKLLMQLSANFAKIPVVTGPVEATAIGNVIGQAIAAGDIGSLDEGREIVKKSFPTDIFLPE